MREIIAVDFDGTLSTNSYPLCGKPNKRLIRWLKKKKLRGACLILWTCRCDKFLEEAIEWCEEQELSFDYINDNSEDQSKYFGNNPRKIFAHIYIDDRASSHWIPATWKLHQFFKEHKRKLRKFFKRH